MPAKVRYNLPRVKDDWISVDYTLSLFEYNKKKKRKDFLKIGLIKFTKWALFFFFSHFFRTFHWKILIYFAIFDDLESKNLKKNSKK